MVEVVRLFGHMPFVFKSNFINQELTLTSDVRVGHWAVSEH